MTAAPRHFLAALFLAPVVLTATVSAPPAHASGQTLQVWLTTADGTSKLSPQTAVTLGSVTSGTTNVVVNDSLKFQSYTGLGAAMTDSAASLLSSLHTSNPTAYGNLIASLFSTTPADGIGLSILRIPMGASDFISESSFWTDDDTQGPSNDPTQNFALQSQETSMTIPRLKDALAQNSALVTVASPWSAPAWMKSNGSLLGATNCGFFGCNIGKLNSGSYQAWADYFRKWIQAYQGQGVPISAISPQNEPLNAPSNYPGMYWDEPSQSNWIHNYLAPTLKNAGLTPEGLGYDHNWDYASFPQNQLNDTSNPAGNDLGGIAWHCYQTGASQNGLSSNTFEPAAMTELHNAFPNKDTYETECSTPWGFNTSSSGSPSNEDPGLSPKTVLLSLQNWAKGALLWNLALNPNHGPDATQSNCQVNAQNGQYCNLGLVTIDTSAGTVTKNNVYYQIGQVSRFVQRNATHIGSTVNAHGIVTAAFANPNGQEVLVAHNSNSASTTFTTTWNGQGSFSYTLPAGATATFVGNVPAAPVLSGAPAAGHVYRFQSKVSGKPFDVSGESTSDGAKIVQQTDDGDSSQQWKLVAVGNGSYNLINMNSGKALDNTGSNNTGVQLQQWTITGTGNQNQQWSITSLADGDYTITNAGSGQAVDLTSANLGDGTAIQQWTVGSNDPNQEWQLVPVS